MDIDNLAPMLAKVFGVDPATLVLYLGLLVTASNIISRRIPQDAVGFWGAVRTVAAFIGLHVSNRVTGNLTVNDAAAIALDKIKVPIGEERIEAVAEKVEDAKLFPGYGTTDLSDASGTGLPPRDDKGRFTAQSPWWAGLIALMLGALLLSGCAGLGGINSAGSVICKNRDEAMIGLLAAEQRALTIADGVKREAALGAIRTSMAALDKCPPTKPE